MLTLIAASLSLAMIRRSVDVESKGYDYQRIDQLVRQQSMLQTGEVVVLLSNESDQELRGVDELPALIVGAVDEQCCGVG